MKLRLLTAILFLSFYNNLLAEDLVDSFRFSDKDCKELAKEFSDTAFEQKKMEMKKNAKLYTEETWKYFSKTQDTISSGFNKLCTGKKNNVSLADIYKEQLNCSIACKENIKIVKGAFFKIVEDINKTKERSKEACLFICNEGQQKLDSIKIGITYGIKNKNSPDCSGAVTNLERNKVKVSEIEQIINQTKKDITK